MFRTLEHCLPKELVLMRFNLLLKQKGSEKKCSFSFSFTRIDGSEHDIMYCILSFTDVNLCFNTVRNICYG